MNKILFLAPAVFGGSEGRGESGSESGSGSGDLGEVENEDEEEKRNPALFICAGIILVFLVLLIIGIICFIKRYIRYMKL